MVRHAVNAINPQIVRVPDGRVGCLVHRMGLQGCVEFGQQRVLETYPLGILIYHITLPPRAPRPAPSRHGTDIKTVTPLTVTC